MSALKDVVSMHTDRWENVLFQHTYIVALC